MSRPLRHQFQNAIYHVTTRGNRRANIYADDYDRHVWLHILEEAAARFNLAIYGLCLMPNHFHLLVQTPDANLAAAMHYLNGKYAQKFNWRHGLGGHLYQGRYHAGRVEEQEHLLELLRYIVLNPVRAQLVEHVDEWQWSTHPHLCNPLHAPAWLIMEWVLAQFSGTTDAERVKSYRAFVENAAPSRMQGSCLPAAHGYSRDASSADPVPTLASLEHKYPHRKDAVTAAWTCSAYTRDQIARHFGISAKTVDRLVAKGTSQGRS